MYQDTDTFANQIISGYGLKLLVQGTRQLFEIAPWSIFDDISFIEIKDNSDVYNAADSEIERLENQDVSVGHTKITSGSVVLTEKSRREPLDHLTNLNTKNANFKMEENSMSKIVDLFIRNMYYNVNSIFESATYIPAGQTIDLSGGSYVQWDTAATAKPRADVADLMETFMDSVAKDIDMSKITAFMSYDLVKTVLATTDFGNWKQTVYNSGYALIPNEIMLSSYFNVRVIILPNNLFSSKFVLAYVDKPIGTQTIGNNLLNDSSIITGFFNLSQLDSTLSDTSLTVTLNGITGVLPGAVILGKKYPKDDQRGFWVDGMTINSVYVHNQKALAKFSNITSS
jgi:hypothetical protein